MLIRRHRTRFSGFTLIELLVVIAIIAILAAILFPVFAQARERARHNACLSQLRQVSQAFQMYVQDFDETFPPAYYPGRAGQTQPDNYGFFFWPWLVYPYVKSFVLFHCPDEPPSEYRDPTHIYFGYVFGRFPAWGYNTIYLSPGIDPFNPELDPYKPIALARVSQAADTLLLVESISLLNRPGQSGILELGYFQVLPPSRWRGTTPPFNTGFCWHRHFNQFANTTFVDGHVKALTIPALRQEELWRAER